jgi:hypothetical protein
MYKAYIYPNPASKKNVPDIAGSPYVPLFNNAIKKYFTIVNQYSPTKYGVLDILKYFFRIDYLFFNWIEDLPDKKGGYLQSILLVFILLYMKTKKKKIVWIMHNKLSHHDTNIGIKQFIFKLMLRKSDIIITHAREGIEYANILLPGTENKIHFIHHPLMKSVIDLENVFKYDIIIWGKIMPYKGIDKFLKYLKDNSLHEKYKIYIAGTILPEEYIPEIMQYASSNIIIENRFLSEEELNQRVSESKIILFTYTKNSVLSSAALIDSLVYNRHIIGPSSGAFKDLAEEGIIHVFSDYDQLINIIDEIRDKEFSIQKRYQFIIQHNWEAFATKINEWINKQI